MTARHFPSRVTHTPLYTDLPFLPLRRCVVGAFAFTIAAVTAVFEGRRTHSEIPRKNNNPSTVPCYYQNRKEKRRQSSSLSVELRWRWVERRGVRPSRSRGCDRLHVVIFFCNFTISLEGVNCTPFFGAQGKRGADLTNCTVSHNHQSSTRNGSRDDKS